MSNRFICRGKRKDNDEWVEGYYVCLNENCHRIYIGYAEKDCGDYYPEYCEVIPETVGQCTGLKDKNGKLIFEGDILLFINDDGEKTPYKVFWSEEYAGYIIVTNDRAVDTMDCWDKYRKNFEVIGNIHDNPELLEVKE